MSAARLALWAMIRSRSAARSPIVSPPGRLDWHGDGLGPECSPDLVGECGGVALRVLGNQRPDAACVSGPRH